MKIHRNRIIPSVLLLLSALSAAPSRADMVEAVSFQDGLGSDIWTTMPAAFDGKNYWTSSGGGNYDTQEAQYDASGKLIATYAPGLDFRSIFTDPAGRLLARQFADPTIYIQVEPGKFTPYVTLNDGSLDAQSAVVLNGAGTEYIAQINGAVDRWDLSGKYLGETILQGYGKLDGESDYPNGRGIAAFGKYYLTYSNGVLSTWDADGNRIATDTLKGAGTGFDSHFSFGYANGMPFVVDKSGGMWRGFSADGASPLLSPGSIPEPSSVVMLGIGALGVGGYGWRRRVATRLEG